LPKGSSLIPFRAAHQRLELKREPLLNSIRQPCRSARPSRRAPRRGPRRRGACSDRERPDALGRRAAHQDPELRGPRRGGASGRGSPAPTRRFAQAAADHRSERPAVRDGGQRPAPVHSGKGPSGAGSCVPTCRRPRARPPPGAAGPRRVPADRRGMDTGSRGLPRRRHQGWWGGRGPDPRSPMTGDLRNRRSMAPRGCRWDVATSAPTRSSTPSCSGPSTRTSAVRPATPSPSDEGREHVLLQDPSRRSGSDEESVAGPAAASRPRSRST
jgi:hypothetical protein